MHGCQAFVWRMYGDVEAGAHSCGAAGLAAHAAEGASSLCIWGWVVVDPRG